VCVWAGCSHGEAVEWQARMFAEALKPTSVVWEWGSGSSSLYFSQCVRQWTSIEHSIKTGWCGKMQELVPPNAEVRRPGLPPGTAALLQ
jgi:hypothetical protein